MTENKFLIGVFEGAADGFRLGSVEGAALGFSGGLFFVGMALGLLLGSDEGSALILGLNETLGSNEGWDEREGA